MKKFNLKSNTVFCFIGIIFIFSFLFFNLNTYLVSADSAANFVMKIFYAQETHTIDTTAVFTETLLNPNNSSLDTELPADVLSSGEEVEMTMYSTPENSVTIDKPLPSGKLGADIFYNISFKKTSDNSVISYFDKAVALTFHYNDSDISGIIENTLTAYRWNGSAWIVLSDSIIDTSLNKITATTQHFSNFAILGNASPFCGDGSCNNFETCGTCPADCGSCGNIGGGGGGGFVIQPTTSISFSGRAYPRSVVTLLKDAQIVATTVAGADANFQVDITSLSAGNYIFSIYSKDKTENRSTILTFPVTITKGVIISISGIFIAPTIAVDKSKVKQGDNIAIFGQSAPQADITISVHSEEEFFVKTNSDNNGIYLYNFDTAMLEMGDHLTKSKTALNNEISSFSKVVSFTVGTETIKDIGRCGKADLNCDARVNLVDFSIAAFWYKRIISAEFAAKEAERLNNDGKIDLIDFSIMAYHWTG